MRPDTTEETFEPVWWLPEGHSQTLWRKFSGAETVEHARNRVELEDGGFIDVDLLSASQTDAARQRALVVLLHGLCGSSSSSYILSLQWDLSKEGYSSVAMNLIAGGEPITLVFLTTSRKCFTLSSRRSTRIPSHCCVISSLSVRRSSRPMLPILIFC